MASVIFTSKPAAAVTVVPNQNTTFTVTASTDINLSSYTYQWKKTPLGGSTANIAGATSSSYFFEPALTDGNASYTCSVSALSTTANGNICQATAEYSPTTYLTVSADSGIYFKYTLPAALNPLNESGAERFRRVHNVLGY